MVNSEFDMKIKSHVMREDGHKTVSYATDSSTVFMNDNGLTLDKAEVPITEAEYKALLESGEIDPDVWYRIEDGVAPGEGSGTASGILAKNGVTYGGSDVLELTQAQYESKKDYYDSLSALIVVKDGDKSMLLYKGNIINLSSDASGIAYDNTKSGLDANTVQKAIDILSEGTGASIQLDVTTTSDSFVGKTINVYLDNVIVVTGVFSSSKKVSLKVKEYGLYTVVVEDDSAEVNVDMAKLYTVTINESPKATINVTTATTSFYGKTVTCSKSGETITKTFSDSGTVQFRVKTTGTWTIACEGKTNSVNVTDLTATYSTEVHIPYATINVTTKETSWHHTPVVLKKGSTTVDTSSFSTLGTCSFTVLSTGTYTIETNGKAKTVEVTVLDKSYEVSINGLEIVTFADGTDDQIAAMIEAHYAGDINIADYWAVGNKRKIHLNTMAATGVSESHHADDYEFVIIGINHDDMTAGGKAALTLQTDRILFTNTTAESDTSYDAAHEYGYMNSTNTNSGGWTSCARRTWCNNVFFASLPSWLQALVKTVNKKTSAGAQSSTINTTQDKAFLVSEIEVFGTTTYSFAGEGTQYDYFKTASNRYKKPVYTGYVSARWWERSPISSNSTHFCLVNRGGTAGYDGASYCSGLAPAFCI